MSWNKALQKSFSDALPFPALLGAAQEVLTGRGLTPEGTLFATCVCRDELNQGPLNAFADHWGECFSLGGLGGYPGAGVTGVGACAAHIPDDGHLLIVYGPHLGVNEKGQIGRVRRPSMSEDTSACGALLSLLGKLQENESYAVKPDPLDHEQNQLEQALLPQRDAILCAKDPIVEVTERAFQVADKRLRAILMRSGYEGPVVLIGGITLNTPPECADRFALRQAEIACFRGDGGTERAPLFDTILSEAIKRAKARPSWTSNSAMLFV
ncbi:MAG: hypothetical protein ACYS22_14330 [Planctomycetota bacterium]|jgi:hypothetical protein